MKESKRLFGTNGIRAIVNRELTAEFAINIGEAVGTFFRRGKVVLGCDGRTSNSMLANAVSSGLLSTGCNVHDVGIAPTPCIQYAVKNHKTDGGVVITASHNPPEYNGIKVIGKDGVEISRQQEISIENVFSEKKVAYAAWNHIGRRHFVPSVIAEYRSAIRQHVDEAMIRKRHYNVVVDAANGVGALAAPYLLQELGCRVTTINANLDGTFPNRPPEPKPENLKDLVAAVKIVGADLGVAFDGDADRSIFVDEKGRVQWGDRTFALIVKDYLKSKRGETVVTPVSSSQVVKDVTEKCGGSLILTRVGSTIVSHTMKRLRSKLGGEENGGVFYGPHQPVRDAAMTAALVLKVMAKTGAKLSQLMDALPRYYLEKDKVKCPNKEKELVLKNLVAQVKHLKPQNIDGVKLWFPEKSSILIRPSGTEPVYRLYAEAQTKKEATGLLKEYKRKLREIIGSKC